MNWVILVFGSAIMVAIGDLIRKHVLKHEHPLEQLAAEAPLRLVLLIFLVPFVTIPSIKELILIAFAAAVLVTTIVYRNRTLRHLPISTVAPLQNLSPVILLGLAVILLGEQPTMLQAGGILLVALGGYVLDLHGKALGPMRQAVKNPYSWIVVLSLILLSIMAMIDKTMLTTIGLDAMTYLFWLYLFSSVWSLLADGALYRWKGVGTDLRRGWYWLLIIAVTSIINISLFYVALGMPGVLVSLAVPIRRTATLIETVLGGRLFHEDGVWRKTIGCAVMLAGLLLIV